MSTVDDLMLLAYEYADEYAEDMTISGDDHADTRQTAATRKKLRAAIESALRAEYERGRSEHKRKPLTDEQIGKVFNASREADEGPTALLRRFERTHGIGDE